MKIIGSVFPNFTIAR